MVRVEIALKGSDVDCVAGTKVFDPQSGVVDAARLPASTVAIAAYVTAHAVVHRADGTPCKASNAEIAPDQDGVTARLTWSCNEVEGDLIYRSTVLIDVDPSAKQIVFIGSEPNATQALLDALQPEVKISTPPPPLLHVVLRSTRASSISSSVTTASLSRSRLSCGRAAYGRSSGSSPPSRWCIQ